MRIHPYVSRAITLYIIINVMLMLSLLIFPSFRMIRWIYNFNTLTAPACLLLLSMSFLLIKPLRSMLSRKHHFHVHTSYIIIVLMLFGLRLYATHYEPSRLYVRNVTITTPGLTAPLRILHISDIQSDAVDQYEKIAFEKMRALDPHLIIHSGDLLQIPYKQNTKLETERNNIAALFRTLNPPLGIYGVSGDTDWRIENSTTEELGGMIMLHNESRTLNSNGINIELIGLKLGASRFGRRGREVISNCITTTDENHFKIAVGHDPSFAMSVKDMDIDLCLAGHTHGGQIRVPFYGPILTMTDVPRDWARGFRKIDNIYLNVSAGIGNEHKDCVPAMRINCPTEMTLITLVPPDTHETEGKEL